MTQLIIQRLLGAIPTLLVVSFLMFLLLFVGPNPLDQLKQNPSYTAADITRMTKQYGWDKPWYEQYAMWGGKFVTGDLGTSVLTQRPASEMLGERIPMTMMLGGMALILSLVIAIPLGTFVAIRKHSLADYSATFMTFGMMALPSFFIGLLLQLMALKMQDVNGGGMVLYTAGAPDCIGDILTCFREPVEVFRRLILPVSVLSMIQVASWSRYQRSEMLGVLASDFVKSARAKGIPERRVILRHAVRNTMMPIVTIAAMDVAMLFGGAVITESVFGLPGMGTLLLDSVRQRDVVVALDIVMIGTILVLVCNTVADVLYGMLDPRVRVS